MILVNAVCFLSKPRPKWSLDKDSFHIGVKSGVRAAKDAPAKSADELEADAYEVYAKAQTIANNDRRRQS